MTKVFVIDVKERVDENLSDVENNLELEEIDIDTSNIHTISTEVTHPANLQENARNTFLHLEDELLETSGNEREWKRNEMFN